MELTMALTVSTLEGGAVINALPDIPVIA